MSAAFVAGVVAGCFGSGYTCAGNSSSSLRPALARSDSARAICHSVYPSLMYPSRLLFSLICTLFRWWCRSCFCHEGVTARRRHGVCLLFALKKNGYLVFRCLAQWFRVLS